jgi:F-actin capping protein, beta subunit
MDAKSGDDFHLSNIGRLIEANETEIRSEMDGIYINKTKQIINTGRLAENYMTKEEKLNFQRELQETMNQMKIDSKKRPQ